jgi:hypothetical protein
MRPPAPLAITATSIRTSFFIKAGTLIKVRIGVGMARIRVRFRVYRGDGNN